MKYSVIIPTNRAIEKILPLLQSLEAQTEQAAAIFIVYDKILGPSELASMQTYVSANCSDDFVDTIERITNINHAFVPHTGVSYMRNFAINAIKTPYILYPGHQPCSPAFAQLQMHVSAKAIGRARSTAVRQDQLKPFVEAAEPWILKSDVGILRNEEQRIVL